MHICIYRKKQQQEAEMARLAELEASKRKSSSSSSKKTSSSSSKKKKKDDQDAAEGEGGGKGGAVFTARIVILGPGADDNAWSDGVRGGLIREGRYVCM